MYYESEEKAKAAAKAVADALAKIANATGPEWTFYRVEASHGTLSPSWDVVSDSDRADDEWDSVAVVRIPYRPGTFAILAYDHAANADRLVQRDELTRLGITV